MSRVLPSPVEAVVVTPTFHGAATLPAAVASVESSALAWARRTGHPSTAVVHAISDDGSTDDTREVVRALAERCAIPLLLDPVSVRRGRAAARNRAAALVDADALLFLDHDDEFLPEHVALCLGTLAERPDLDYVKTGVVLSDAVHADWREGIVFSLTQNLCVRRELHQRIGGFLEDPEVETYGCDDVLYNRLCREFGRGLTLPEETVRFLRRPGNSFDRQYRRKFSRAREDAEPTLEEEQLRVRDAMLSAYERRRGEVRARLERLRRIAAGPGTRLRS